MENLDLDINNYSTRDLEAFFQFSPDRQYSVGDIETREYTLREQFLASGQVNIRFKSRLVEFLTFAKERLIYAKSPPQKPPTTILGHRTAEPETVEMKTNKLDRIYENRKAEYRRDLDPYNFPAVSDAAPPRTNELVAHPDAQFVYTNPSEFFQGTLNPLTTRILTKCLNIDTRFRKDLFTTSSSDFSIQLPIKLYKVVSMELASIEFPVDFYTISEHYGNNYLYLYVNYYPIDSLYTNDPKNPSKYNGDDDALCSVIDVEHVFIIPNGNYTDIELVDELNGQLSKLALYDGIFSYIQLELCKRTNKVTITTTGKYGNKITSITMDFTKDIKGNPGTTDPYITVGWNLGFINSAIYTGYSMYVADATIDCRTVKYAFLAIEDFNNSSNNYFVSVFQKSMLNQNILARISTQRSIEPHSSKSLHTLHNISDDTFITTEPRRYFGPVDIQRLHIRLYDEFGRILPMNNANYSFCLTMKMIYDL